MKELYEGGLLGGVILLGLLAAIGGALVLPLFDRSVSWCESLAVVALLVPLALLHVWLMRRERIRFRRDTAFFDPALQLVEQRFRQFAQQTGGTYLCGATAWSGAFEPSRLSWSEYTGGSGRLTFTMESPDFIPRSMVGYGPRVHCSYRGFHIELSSSVEELKSGLAMVPRVWLRLPPGLCWQRIPYSTIANSLSGFSSAFDPDVGNPTLSFNYRAPGVLWLWEIEGPEQRPFQLATAAEQSSFDALTQVTCCVLAYKDSLDVRGWPANGIYDPQHRVGHASFDVTALFDLVERTANFAHAAAREPTLR
jgi:hypothetical protein